MQRNSLSTITKVLLLLLVAVLLAKKFYTKTPIPAELPQQPKTVLESHDQREPSDSHSSPSTAAGEIPHKVIVVLEYIKANHHAMDGYVGGRTFTNYERVVPWQDQNGQRIYYQEWDVNPKIEGQNRGTERILTGSDGRSWYTNDHYHSFIEIH